MSITRVECSNTRYMENLFAKMQEIYAHVEFISYDGSFLTFAYVS